MPDARSTVVREEDPEGKLYAIDVNIHDLGAQLPYGAAKRLRLVEGVPSAAAPPSRRLLGEIPLADDGSFQVQIPANTPVQLQLLDADGLAIRSSAWLWVRNHGAQGCVGCHEDQERTPPNRFVKALQAPAPVLNLPPEKRRTVGYAGGRRSRSSRRSASPAIAGVARRSAGRLSSRRARPASRPHLSAGEARRSRLVWHLLGRNVARPWDPEAGAPAAKPVPPDAVTPDEVRAFIEWIDLGGQP